jgi:hypothetical protein
MSYWTLFANPEGVSVHIHMDVYSVRLSGSLITGWWSISASPIRLISDIAARKLVLASVKSESFTMSNFLLCGGDFKYLFMPWRFAETTEEEIQTKRLKLNADNTLKANKKSANILRDYLKEKHQDSLFENYDTVRLNETLAHFYMDLRKSDGGRYKATSFESIRHGINRYLKSPSTL